MLGYQYSEWNNYSTSSFQTTISTINFQAWSMLLPKLQNSVLFPATFCNFASKQAVPSVMQNVPSVMVPFLWTIWPIHSIPCLFPGKFYHAQASVEPFLYLGEKGWLVGSKKNAIASSLKSLRTGHIMSIMSVMVHCHKQGRKVTGHISMSVFQGCPRTLLVCCRVVINPLGLFEVKYSNILLPKSRFLSRP